jgi:4-aminobutyrate aminotransferase-like enzyme/Ser/Thr protein kinase RdoA (MazF antagonist)
MSLLHSAPRFSTTDAAQLARMLYGIHADASRLPSERDQNFLLTSVGGEQYVLKIANAAESWVLLNAQNQAMRTMAANAVSPLCPRVIHSLDGQAICTATAADGTKHFVRLLTYLPGVPLATVKPQTPALLADLGRVMGEIDRSLVGFDHLAAHRDFHWDVAQAAPVIRDRLNDIFDSGRRRLVEGHLARFEEHTAPKLVDLRWSVIHGDANDYNVLVSGDGDLYAHHQRVSGLLDWGDMVYSCLACEPAIAAAYAMLGKEDPLTAAAQVVAGYHSVHPLQEDEIAALYDLMVMRLCLSVCHSAHQQAAQPENRYLSVSEAPAWELLHRLATVHPRFAHYTLRAACGLSPSPHSPAVARYLIEHRSSYPRLIDADLRCDPVAVLDLSVGSLLLGSDTLTGSVAAFSKKLFDRLAETGAAVGIGRYDEARAIYTSPAFALFDSPTAERRTVHLGIDLFVEPGATVYAPLDGVVHALHDNSDRLDFGPLILLRHATDAGEPFFTLYGHLSRESLDGLTVRQKVAAGERIAAVGAPPINGDWPPHLHFQIVTDLLDLEWDFPGVAAPSRAPVWRSLSPDPNLLLGIPADRFPPRERSRDETLAERRQRIGRNLSISYRRPLKIVRGLGQYLYDEDGRAYLDCVNNVAHVGHCHPHVVAAGQRQMAVLNTNTRYLHDNIVEYARRLTETLPEPLSVCFFVCSGSEANDLALRLARTHTGQQDMICVDVAYHGHTQALIEVSPYKHEGAGGKGRPAYVQKVMMPDPYRGSFKGYGAESGRNYAEDVRAAVETIQRQGREVAGFICESLMGCGGQIVFPDGYMAAAFEHVRAAGGLCIADEVQVGFGRVGSHMWGFETQGCLPDIVTLGKPIGNGHPLAAVVTTPEIAETFANGMEYFNTFGGNPVSCAIGLAVLDVVEGEQLQANALAVGNHLMERLRELMTRHALIGDVRGLGLYIGVELVLDRATLTPAGEQASYIANRARDYGVLISTDGPFHNVLKIKPPIIFSRSDADHLVETLDTVLGEDAVQVLKSAMERGIS